MYIQNESRTSQYVKVVEEKGLSSLGLRVALTKPRPYFLSSVALSVYVFTIVILSKNPVLVDLSQYIGFALAGIFVFEFVVNRGKLLLPKELGGFVIFFGLMIFGALWVPNQDTAITRAVTFFQLLLFGLIAVNIMVARGSIKPLAIGMLVGLLWAVFLALDEQGFRFMTEARYRRVGSLLSNANMYAISLLIGCMIVWYLFQNSGRKVIRVLLLILALIFLHQIIFYAGSRKGILAIFLIFPVFLLLRQLLQSDPSLRRIVGTIFIIAALFFIGWQVVKQSIFISRIESFQHEITEGTRGQMIRYALDMWLDRPLLGHGTEQFRALSPWAGYSHNNYVELLANNGLIGLLVFYSFFVTLIKKYIRSFQRGHLATIELSWSLSFVILLLFLDVGMVSYYAKPIWLAYIALVALSYIFQFDDSPFPKTRLECQAGTEPYLASASNCAPNHKPPG